MLKNLNRFIYVFLCAVFMAFSFASQAQNNKTQISLPQKFKEYTLENSMKVFVLEDFSNAPVRIELAVHAGFSAQTPKTAGFFPLYTNLFAKAAVTSHILTTQSVLPQNLADSDFSWYLKNLQSECNADSSRYIITVSPQQVEQTLTLFSAGIFLPIITDKDLTDEFSALKTQVIQNVFSTAGFINSSIDSRVFASEPWKQDSGIYPAIFTNTPVEEARTILTSIGRNYYAPQNCAIFISGGISSDTALNLARRHFQKMAVSAAGILSDSMEKTAAGAQRKFVLHDPLFTNEMSQIVIQYTNLSMQQADIAAAILDNYNSNLKNTLAGTAELSIRDKEYINVASAHKNGSSRLIFQSLLEKNKKSSPCEQAEIFLQTVKKSADELNASNAADAKNKLISQFKTRFKNSSAFMELLSQFWAITNVSEMHTENTSQELILQPEIILQTDENSIADSFRTEEPFVFILVNSDVYRKNAKAFKKAGYEEVNTKNGSWYSQKLYEQVKNSFASAGIKNGSDIKDETEESEKPDIIAASTEAFSAENENQFSSFRLSNEIPVIIKRSENSATAVISLAISGGKLSTACKNTGLSEIMINALARNIQKYIYMAEIEKQIAGEPEVLAESNLAGGIITVECLAEDVHACLSCISNAIIYGSIKPAEADGLIYDRRSQHRIQRASPEYQLFCEGVKQLYKDTDYPFAFTLQEEILTDTSYMEILASYPSLLNAAKYSLVLAGNIPGNGLKGLLEECFGVLVNQTKNEFRLYYNFPKPDFSFDERDVKVQLEHKFAIDTRSKQIGDMPPLLIPTREFFDPVQYWLPSPAQDSRELVIFNAIIYELESRLLNEIKNTDDKVVLDIKPASAEIQAAVITFSNVQRTGAIDELYKKTVQSALNPEQDESIVTQIKNRWILKSLLKTQTNRGVVLLMRTGLEEGNIAEFAQESQGVNPAEAITDSVTAGTDNENNGADTDIQAAKRYIKEYEIISSATAQDFLTVAQKYLLEKPPLRIYSKDSKK